MSWKPLELKSPELQGDGVGELLYLKRSRYH